MLVLILARLASAEVRRRAHSFVGPTLQSMKSLQGVRGFGIGGSRACRALLPGEASSRCRGGPAGDSSGRLVGCGGEGGCGA